MFLSWCLLGCMIITGLLSADETKVFIKDDFIVHDLALSTPKYKKWAGSITHCALLCEHEPDCVNFMYKKNEKKCNLYAKSTPNLRIKTDEADLDEMASFRVKADGKEACEDNGYFYNRNRGLCWRYNEENLRFADAMRACKAVGARIIQHISADDAQYMNKIHRQNGIDGAWYIGMTDKDKEGAWRWHDKTWSNFKFTPGADNNFDGAYKAHDADCAVVHKKTSDLFDVYCGARYSFVCERLDLL